MEEAALTSWYKEHSVGIYSETGNSVQVCHHGVHSFPCTERTFSPWVTKCRYVRNSHSWVIWKIVFRGKLPTLNCVWEASALLIIAKEAEVTSFCQLIHSGPQTTAPPVRLSRKRIPRSSWAVIVIGWVGWLTTWLIWLDPVQRGREESLRTVLGQAHLCLGKSRDVEKEELLQGGSLKLLLNLHSGDLERKCEGQVPYVTYFCQVFKQTKHYTSPSHTWGLPEVFGIQFPISLSQHKAALYEWFIYFGLT